MPRIAFLLLCGLMVAGCERTPRTPEQTPMFATDMRCLPEASTQYGLVLRCPLDVNTTCFVYEGGFGGSISCVSR